MSRKGLSTVQWTGVTKVPHRRRRVGRRALAAMVLVLAGTAWGCGEDSADNPGTAGSAGAAGGGTGGTGGTAAAGAGGAAGQAGAAGAAGVAGAGGATLAFLITDENGEPLEGAIVALDAPGGERKEGSSEADGSVTFDGVDWSAGNAAVTAYMPGHVVVSSVDFDEAGFAEAQDENGEVQVGLTSLAPTAAPETVTVSGTAANLENASHLYTVNIFGANEVPFVEDSEWGGYGSNTFKITVPKGVPFRLQAFEYEYTALPSGQGYERPIYGVMQMDLGPIDTDATDVILDFAADKVTTNTADVAMLLPTRPDSAMHDGSPYCFTCAKNSYYCEGWPTFLDISDDGNQFDMSFLWAEHPNLDGPNWFCRITKGEEISQTSVDGYPQDGSNGTILDVPQWVTPSDLTKSHPLHEPMEWAWTEPEITQVLAITNGGSVVWTVNGPSDATTITVPELPSTADAMKVLGLAPRALVYGGEVGEDSWVRYAQSKSIGLKK